MNFIKLTLLNGNKVLINLNKVNIINPNNTKSTILSFRGEEDYTEVLESLDEIEAIIKDMLTK